MSKKLLIEKRSQPLNYIKESRTEGDKKYLARLVGVGANFLEPTRNGRKYTHELWVNVQNSPDFKEGMETLTIFGECDHPEDRIDTSIKEIAIVLTKFEIRQSEGIVWVEFDILDTPNGRILKELLDYGSKIGVSSRGLGDEIIKDGETIIDPETYEFYAFDAVVMPAVKSARPTVTESAKRSLTESVIKEIENTTSVQELESIKRIVENVNMCDMDSINESINIKLEGYNKDRENISSKLEADLVEISKENEQLHDKVKSLEEKLSAKDIRVNELTSRLRQMSRGSRKLANMLRKSKLDISELQESIADTVKNNSKLEQMSHKETERFNILLSDAVSLNKKMKNELKLAQKENSQLVESNNKLLEENKSLIKKVNLLESIGKTNLQLSNRIKELENSRRLSESSKANEISKLSTSIRNIKKQLAETNNKYINSVCARYGIPTKSVIDLLPKNYSTEDIDRVVLELADKKDRINKLPIALTPKTVVLNEDLNMTPEDKQTLMFLTGSKE